MSASIWGSTCVAATLLLLQGCHQNATVTTTSKPPKDHACYDNGTVISSGECCCLWCGGEADLNVQEFGVYSIAACMDKGGQCKTVGTSLFQRPPPARRLHDSHWTAKTDQNTFQQHLIGGQHDRVQFVFVGDTLPRVTVREVGKSATWAYVGNSSSYSFFMNPTGWNGYESSSRGSNYSDCVHHNFPSSYNSSCYYTSDPIHRVDALNLTGGVSYEYQVEGDHHWLNFTMPPAPNSAVCLGFTADLGQTDDSLLTMKHMSSFVDERKIDAVIFPGDLSYADGAAHYWDQYGRLSSFLFGRIPTAYGVGNHEYTSGFENFQNFLPRYSWPAVDDHSGLWFSYNTGYAHVIMLCSYCDVTSEGGQLTWLLSDLKNVNRTQTPWVVAAWHTPWYTSSSHHNMSEAATMREAFEQHVYQHVDLVVTGHVHAYERTTNIFQNKTDVCGPVYITIGDGGNHEGPACGWNLNYTWSKAKEFSFGFGTFNITSANQATWSWYRNQDHLVAADVVTMTRPTSRTNCDTPIAITV